ncbi:MAG: hypothetical protein AB1429_02255 [Pseudomonadota bacterium]|jgi:hypothetical protein
MQPDAIIHADHDLTLATWKSQVKAQGLVCLVCGEAPELADRNAFFDTGVCAACAWDMTARERAADSAA